ncbi:MAG TPA: DUF5668 domain-containing protein [Thermoanaerobaculia bacterium]|nr:DUF5668 domain-containing protein [Thermoanaerobaculia bacterium]
MNPSENPWPQEAPPPAPIAAPIPVTSTLPDGVARKSPALAAFLSLFPGLGHLYNGLYMRGLTFFLIVASLIALTAERGHPLFGLGIAFFWLFNVMDAYRQATLINYGYAQDLGLTDLPLHPRASQGGLAAGIILTLIGLVAFLDRFFVIDLEWLLDFWPVALMGIGLWLIVAAIRDRRKTEI